MKAYVEIVQRKEREIGTDVLTHQKVHVHPSLYIVMCLPLVFTVEWCRLRRQPHQDRYWWCVVDVGDGQGCH